MGGAGTAEPPGRMADGGRRRAWRRRSRTGDHRSPDRARQRRGRAPDAAPRRRIRRPCLGGNRDPRHGPGSEP